MARANTIALFKQYIDLIDEVYKVESKSAILESNAALVKNGGRIADAGSVAFQFTRKGVITVEGTGEELLLQVLDAGAEDAVEEDGEIIVYTDLKDLASVRNALAEQGLKVKDAELRYIANTPVEIADSETAQKLMKVVDALDDLDDVVNVHTNADITADV